MEGLVKNKYSSRTQGDEFPYSPLAAGWVWGLFTEGLPQNQPTYSLLPSKLSHLNNTLPKNQAVFGISTPNLRILIGPLCGTQLLTEVMSVHVTFVHVMRWNKVFLWLDKKIYFWLTARVEFELARIEFNLVKVSKVNTATSKMEIN